MIRLSAACEVILTRWRLNSDPHDDYAGTLANFKKNGAQILEERVNNGRHVRWVAAPDGAQMELIEKV
jgi:hypothetical protein